jgi:hypothetical protein
MDDSFDLVSTFVSHARRRPERTRLCLVTTRPPKRASADRPSAQLGPARLSIVYNADSIVAAGGDIALSPDNLDLSRRHLMIN